MGNPFVHIDLRTQNLGPTKAFYSKLFDWKLEEFSMGGSTPYTMVHVGEGTGGGFLQADQAGWLPWIGVADVVASTQKAKELGATIVSEPTEYPGFGKGSIVLDPTGTTVGLWQPAAR